MGYRLESYRVEKIDNMYFESEMLLLDQRIQRDSLEFIGLNCNSLIKENIKFADKVYEEALTIQKYENANRINSEVILQHKRYDLLRTLFWINSIRIKEKCKSDYHNIVYIYQYNDPSLDQKAQQRVFSKILEELKAKKGDEIMLIPLAGDNDLSSINLLMEKYEITSLPVILIDEKVRIENVETLEDIEKHLE